MKTTDIKDTQAQATEDTQAQAQAQATEDTKVIKLYVEDKTTADGRKFKSYKTVTKNGRKITCKIRQDVTNKPTEDALVTVKIDDMNMQKDSEYPTLWLSAIESWEPMKGKVDVEANRKTINEWF